MRQKREENHCRRAARPAPAGPGSPIRCGFSAPLWPARMVMAFLRLVVKSCRWLVLAEGPWFWLWQLCYFCNVVTEVNTIRGQYLMSLSPCMSEQMGKWWCQHPRTQLSGQCRLLLLLEMTLCLLVAWSFEARLGASVLPRSSHHSSSRFGKILLRLSPACLHSVIFVWIQWGGFSLFVCFVFFKRFLADLCEGQWVPSTEPLMKGSPV